MILDKVLLNVFKYFQGCFTSWERSLNGYSVEKFIAITDLLKTKTAF